MFDTVKELKKCIKYERYIYSSYMFDTRLRYFMSWLKHEPARRILSFLVVSRKCDFYNKHRHGVLNKIKYFYYVSRRNRLGEKMGLEVSTENIKPGLLIYHYNNVVNGGAVIGRNCHLHGNNCIGNAGPHDLRCPVIGDNVMLGVGAKVIGNITIANDIKIAAGAVVVTSFLEEGITIGGIPAKKIK